MFLSKIDQKMTQKTVHLKWRIFGQNPLKTWFLIFFWKKIVKFDQKKFLNKLLAWLNPIIVCRNSAEKKSFLGPKNPKSYFRPVLGHIMAKNVKIRQIYMFLSKIDQKVTQKIVYQKWRILGQNPLKTWFLTFFEKKNVKFDKKNFLN